MFDLKLCLLSSARVHLATAGTRRCHQVHERDPHSSLVQRPRLMHNVGCGALIGFHFYSKFIACLFQSIGKLQP